MASAFSHAAVALALGKAVPLAFLNRRAIALGMLCSVVADLDVIGFQHGIHYGDLWGHRGLSHSLLFAAAQSLALVAIFYFRKPAKVMLGLLLYLFLCSASHGILDAMTDGGLGVAFLSPIDTTRYFFGFRPIAVSPIGVEQFFGQRGLEVLINEVKWIWLPSLAFVLLCRTFAKLRTTRP